MHRNPERSSVALADGRRLCARTWPGEGRPLVLLHGLLDTANGWDGVARATRHPCIALDLPGFGDSDVPVRPRLSAYAEAVAWALDALDVGEHTLVGHSLGAAVAALVAEREPEQTASLVLLAPAGFGRLLLAELVAAPGMRALTSAVLPVALGSELLVNATYSTLVTHGSVAGYELRDRLHRAARAAAPGTAHALQALAANGVSRRGLHRRRLDYQGPVSAVWGDHDLLVPLGHRDALRRALPQAEIAVWEGMGHHPQRERPVELSELIERASHAGPALPAGG